VSISADDLAMAVALFVAIAVLDVFSVAMPRGDRIAVSGAVCAASVVMINPLLAVAVCTVGLLTAQTMRPGTLALGRMLSELAIRGAAVMSAIAVLLLVGGGEAGFTVQAGMVAAYLLTELAVAQLFASQSGNRGYLRLLRGNMRTQWLLLAAEWSAGMLLLITYGGMGIWGLVPVVALLLLTRQSYALLQQIRETYNTTMRVLVEAAEGQDPRRAGHSDRSAAIARGIAVRMGLDSAEVERISYAALLHDIDVISGDAERSGESTAGRRTGRSAPIIEQTSFFSDVISLLRLTDGDVEYAETASEADLAAAFVVSLSSDVDSARLHDVQLAHEGNAVDRLAAFVPPQTKARVVSAALSLEMPIPAVY